MEAVTVDEGLRLLETEDGLREQVMKRVMARLEQHILQIKKEEPDLLKTVRNGFGQIQRRAEEKEIQFQIILPEQVTCLHDPNWLGERFIIYWTMQ